MDRDLRLSHAERVLVGYPLLVRAAVLPTIVLQVEATVMPSKYHAKKVTLDGITFDSQKEAKRYGWLKQFQHQGIIRSIELQPRFELQPAFKKCCGRVYGPDDPSPKKCPICGRSRKKMRGFRAEEYVADFLVTLNDGTEIVEDVKGKIQTPLFKSKWKRFEYLYPDRCLMIVTDIKAVPT
ncbi:MAG: DUF1064 domain-containing protein [bacterium]